MIRKIIVLFFVLFLLLAILGCGQKRISIKGKYIPIEPTVSLRFSGLGLYLHMEIPPHLIRPYTPMLFFVHSLKSELYERQRVVSLVEGIYDQNKLKENEILFVQSVRALMSLREIDEQSKARIMIDLQNEFLVEQDNE